MVHKRSSLYVYIGAPIRGEPEVRPTWDIHGPLGETGLLDVAVWRFGDG